MTSATLTPTEREFLKFTNLTFQYRGAQETMVREKWDVSMDAFWQVVNRLIDTEAALAACPLEVNRLRRQRDARRRVGHLRAS